MKKECHLYVFQLQVNIFGITIRISISYVFVGNKYVGQVATMVGWNKVENGTESSTCRPRKLGLPVLELSHCFGAAAENINADKGCVGVVGSQNPICKVYL